MKVESLNVTERKPYGGFAWLDKVYVETLKRLTTGKNEKEYS